MVVVRDSTMDGTFVTDWGNLASDTPTIAIETQGTLEGSLLCDWGLRA